MWEKRTAHMGIPEGKGPVGRPGCMYDNSKMDFREIGWGGVDWNHLAPDRDQCRALVNTAINLCEFHKCC
jgi:hypothetical protein